MTEHFDALETRSPEERERALLVALPAQVAHAKANAPFYGRLLADVDPDTITSRAALARLPVTRKSELLETQRANPPLGGFLAAQLSQVAHVYMSPGPIFEVDTAAADHQGAARAMYAAGFRAGDIVAGMMMDASARALGCVVVPGGVGNTELQLDAIAAIRPSGYVGTPSFLKILLDRAAEQGRDVSSLRRALVGAEALPAVLREGFRARGVSVLQCYGTADLGIIAYESDALEGMIVDESILLEIVRPGTGEPVGEGEVGEVVVTTFNRAYPLLRFATGDLSAIQPGQSPCGRTNIRIRGWMGRADQRTKVRGMFVDPAQVAAVAKRHPELGRVRFVVDWVDQADVMLVKAEATRPASELARAVEATVQALCKVRGAVELVPPGTLPNDGKVIDDIRKIEA
ncbi:MAG: AMP-binding protein [Alphaproteobacteria bacterium]|nr:AMP-binding protein [Alphaproteobacteria bacterium]